jgi:hypothetical protein
MQGVKRLTAAAALALAVGLVSAAAASGIAVKGHQTPFTATKFEMTGDLIGKWKVTKIKLVQESPVLKFRGKERFNGCLDSDRDGSCEGEVTGKLFFKFRYWAALDDDDQLELGACGHPVIGGKDGFAGASGFLMFVDVPNNSPVGFSTRYEGDITLGGGAKPAAPRAC